MDVKEPTMDCNLPELLVRDLEVSESVFASKSMTAGYPSLGLATSNTVDTTTFQKQKIPRRPIPACQPPTVKSRPLSLILGSNRTSSVSVSCHHDEEESACQAGLSDSASDAASSVGMEPPSVRTREQSFTTAATSVSGRCSSLVSHKPISPSTAASSRMDRGERTWFDTEADVDANLDRLPYAEPGSSERVERGRLPPRPRSAIGLGAFNVPEISPRPPGANTRPSAAATTLHTPSQVFPAERPHTSSGQGNMDSLRPRIIDIQPPVAVPKRKSSLERIHRRMVPTPAGMDSQQPIGNNAPNKYEDDEANSDESEFTPPSTIPTLATACGRTVIDASWPPSLGRDQVARRVPASAPPQASATGIVFLGDRGLAETHAHHPHPTPPERSRKPSFADFGACDLNMRAFPSRTSSIASSISAPGVPLPPEVVDTLRISISCFPETMLLSSSLSVETIRIYSKKLRHGVNPTNRLSEDSHSLFSFSTSSTKPPGRWNLPKLMQSRRVKKSNRPMKSATAESPVAASAPVTPNWTAIKNIFPTSSDYLCDALYAHLVAYNYVSLFCPQPPVLPMRCLPGSGLYDSNEGSHRIPKKAASVLGLQERAEADGGKDGEHMAFGRSNSRRQAIGDGNSPGICKSGGGDMSTLRNVQAGLGRCIALLVTTLKMTTEQMGLEPMLLRSREPKTIDPLLMRSLCEVVRCSEETVVC
ncbi:hypothetical protein B0T25DRAFT_513344 [Lasiosphaeria hispida]|uniref:Uncharacterized protein n=1 Tax=Lasiosphaeria hispida TaxID=260671 RepID=A0AAJ0HUS7_9PEZI|nr:hypothetical protein B0T25DRAFT_513344 [Lasiosphaeria hispida]